jgi:hypothetical protein
MNTLKLVYGDGIFHVGAGRSLSELPGIAGLAGRTEVQATRAADFKELSSGRTLSVD